MMKAVVGNKIFRSWKAAAAAHGIKYTTWTNRVHLYGWDKARAATERLSLPAMHVVNGIEASRAAHCRRLGISPETVTKRLQRGSTIEDALSIPGRRKFLTAEDRRAARARMRARRVKSRLAKIQAYKTSLPCKDCGGKFSAEAMEFDHCRGKKSFAISQGAHKSLLAIATEIAKCDLVCANCHRMRTATRRK